MKDVSLRFPSFEGVTHTCDDACSLALSDAAWATHPNGSSQGGYFVMLTPGTAFSEKEAENTKFDWRSYKLASVARSSLNAETQAAADVADALDNVKTFWNPIQHPEREVLDPTLRTNAPSARWSMRRNCTTQ
jgi:hypothetical protein